MWRTVYETILKSFDLTPKICNFQSLILLYLIGVIYMVRRQVRQVWREEEEEMVGKVVITDQAGATNIKAVDKIVNDEEEVLL